MHRNQLAMVHRTILRVKLAAEAGNLFACDGGLSVSRSCSVVVLFFSSFFSFPSVRLNFLRPLQIVVHLDLLAANKRLPCRLSDPGSMT